MRINRPVALGVTVGLALGVLAIASPASAEPVSNGLVLVGSDTLQDSVNALTNGTTLTSPGGVRVVAANGVPLGNYDAFGSALIQTKPAGTFYLRPAGSGNGRNALISSITGAPWNGKTITGQIDIARSSSGPGSNANTAGDLLYVPYGKDAVSYAYRGPSADLGNLTTAQLKAIYEADTPTTIGGTVVKPLIPQSGSGTRDFFLSTIGVTTLGDQVPDGVDHDSNPSTPNVGNTTPENDGSVLTQVGEIIPFSAASWIAQANGASGVNTIPSGDVVKLGSPNGEAPYTVNGTTLVPSTTYYASSYGRWTYLIVEFARVNPTDPKYDANLASVVDPARSLSLANHGALATTAGAVKVKFGFVLPAGTDSGWTAVRAYPNVY